MKSSKLLFLLLLIPLASCKGTETSNNSTVEESSNVSTTSVVESLEPSTNVAVYHHVKFVNYNNALLEEQDVLHGQAVTYKGILPTKPEDDEFTYEFLKWDKDLSSVTSDMTIKATYTAVPKEDWGSVIWF